MSLDLAKVNYLAVVIAGLGAFFLGALWYMPLFGKQWIQLNGYTQEQVKQMQAKRTPPVFFGGMIVCYLLVALVMALLITTFKVDSALGGALLGALLWVGPAAAIGMTGHLSSDKHIGVFCIDAGFQLVFLMAMGALLGAWQ